MTAAPHAAPSDASRIVLAALLQARTGQQIAANRAWRLDTLLRPLLAEYRVETIDQIVALVLRGGDHRVADRVVDALLNKETSFFRDAGVLEAVADAAIALGGVRGRARIWSAACSTGQEPLSLAMLFAERQGAGAGPRPEIVATDVSDSAIERARSGRYTQFEIQRGLPIRRVMTWFDGVDGDWIAKPELVARIAFRRHNLVADRAPAGLFDVVLCRNVLFYLAEAARAQVLDRLADALRPGGLLVLGAGETVIGQTTRFRPSAAFRGLYERVPSDEAAIRRAG